MSEELQPNSFERDTLWSMCCQAARYWLVGHFLRTGKLPQQKAVFWAYPERGIDWGKDELRGKRVRITIEVEDMP